MKDYILVTTDFLDAMEGEELPQKKPHYILEISLIQSFIEELYSDKEYKRLSNTLK